MSEIREYAMVINGEPVMAEKTAPVRNPANQEIIGYMPLCTEKTLNQAVEAASMAQKKWSEEPNEIRKAACQNMAKVLSVHAEELATLLTKEQGKPLKGLGSEFEVAGAIAWAEFTASLELPVKTLQDDEAALIEQHRVPVGVVGSITPWNWPLMIAIWHIAPAIRSGNTVILKPSPYTSLCTLRMVEILNTVLPKGVLNCITGDGKIGALISAHADIDKIVFTGSTATGQKVMSSASTTLKRLTLELGGNDAGIVLPDADPEQIVEGLFWGAFINMGQTCAALKRLYVPDSLYDDICCALVKLTEKLPMGDGMNPNTVLGPLQNKMQFDIVKSLVEDAKQKGARILTGGEPLKGEGYFYPITLVADIKAGARLVDEEQFGTALPIIRYENIDDAIEQANSLNVGLAASVWSSDLRAARTVAERLEAGTVYINKHGEVLPHVPFGGIKGSGVGVEFGQEGLEAYTDIKIYNMAK